MKNKKIIRTIAFLFISALIQSFALNNFFETSGLMSGGLTGIALIINRLTAGAVPLGVVLLVFNIPLALLAYFNVGKKFTIYSFINVGLTSVLLLVVPQVIFLKDIMLNAIIGGVGMGLGVALALEAGASTGGTDFVALYMSVKKQTSAGKYMLILNGFIIMASALLFDVEIAVYTLISTFVASRVIDSIHVRYQRVTLAIITSKGDEIIQGLIDRGVHGATKLYGMGGYSQDPRAFIYTVVSTYEIHDIADLIHDIDKQAFINVTSSQQVIGHFEPSKYE